MTRLLEFLAALVIVAILGVVAGVAMPSQGHIDRTVKVNKDVRQLYDIFANFRRFPEYSMLGQLDRGLKYQLSGPAYGQGAKISWTSDDKSVGNGSLEVASLTPAFAQVGDEGKATIVWNLDNDWSGTDKKFTIDLERTGREGKLTNVKMAYDVSYGWNLLNRYSNLYIHGQPDNFIQFGLGNMQNMVASIPQGDYSKLYPEIVDTQPTPVLFISGQAPRNLTELDTALDDGVKQLQAAAKKLNVQVTGPRITFTTNYGDQNYQFDVALPINTTTLNLNGQSVELTAASRPKLDPAAAATSGSGAPAADDTTPGSHDKFNNVIVDDRVRAVLAFGGKALKAEWNGNPAGVPVVRIQEQQFALTHGYKFDDFTNRFYDIQVKAPTTDAHGTVQGYDEQKFEVYLPLQGDVPEKTPEQEAGMKNPGLQDNPASSGTAGAPASSGTAAAPAASGTAPTQQ
jgi:hypothetical protein